MRKRILVLVTAIVLVGTFIAPSVALAGGDQVLRPDECPQYQAVGEDPLALQLQNNR